MVSYPVKAAVLAAIVLTGCGSGGSGSGGGSRQSTTAAKPVVTGLLGTLKSSVGSILVDQSGRTIYFFAIDKPGVSNCSGTCLKYWPPVPAPATLPSSVPGLNAKLGSITRADGSKQLTVAGLPVYTFSGDSAPGALNGQAKNLSGGLWWVISPTGGAITTSVAPASSDTSGMQGGGYGH
jgi:predicted lipoprotein with Yx(FWY)xxD motif